MGQIILINGASSSGKSTLARAVQRRIGDARNDFDTIHELAVYDIELDSTMPAEANATALISAWKQRRGPSAFQRMEALQ